MRDVNDVHVVDASVCALFFSPRRFAKFRAAALCSQTLLFSATLPQALIQFSRAGLKDPEMVRLDVDTKVSENLKVRAAARAVFLLK